MLEIAKGSFGDFKGRFSKGRSACKFKKSEADLEMFGLAAATKQAKQQYGETENRLNRLLTEAKPLLQPKKS